VDSTDNPTTVAIDWPDLTEQTITAVFQPSDVRYMLSVSENNGMVILDPSPSPNGYPINTTVTLVAYAQSGYSFSHWIGALSGVMNSSSLLIDSDKSVTAVFNPTVELASQPSDAGTLTLDPAQPAHGYPTATPVAVRAVAVEGYRFDHWSGDLSGSQNPITIEIDSPKVITANFVKSTPFPWWWILIALVLLLSVFVIARLAYVLVTRRATED
jgi:hypothetical protein